MPEPDLDGTLTIVVGYDGSDAADRALVRAAQLMPPSRGRVAVVTAAPLLVDLAEAPVGRRELPQPDAALAKATERLGSLGARSEGIAVPLEPADALIETARDLAAEVIVVGTRGRGRAARAALGSVSTAVLHHAPCDVLIVRPAPAESDEAIATDWPQNLLVGCDASPWARRALERATQLVRPGGAITLVFAIASRTHRPSVARKRAALERLRDDAVAERGVPVALLEARGDPAAVIVATARARAADLVVVGSRSRGPAARLILGSVSTAVVHQATQDVLVVRR